MFIISCLVWMKCIGGYYFFLFGDEIIFYVEECYVLWWLRKFGLNFYIFKNFNFVWYIFLIDREKRRRKVKEFFLVCVFV